MAKVFGDLADMFPDSFVHTGGDEVCFVFPPFFCGVLDACCACHHYRVVVAVVVIITITIIISIITIIMLSLIYITITITTTATT